MREFAGDAELAGLERLSLDGLERAQEANKLLTLGQAEAAANKWEESTESLRKAMKLDSRSVTIKEALIHTLTEHARVLLESDVVGAQRLQQEAETLDGNHRAVRTLGMEISEARRQTYVGECLTDARALVAEGEFERAYDRIREGREEYRNDSRLEQFEAWLLKENKELQFKQERATRLAELGMARQRLERDPDSEKARNVLRLSRELRREGAGRSGDDEGDCGRGADGEAGTRRGRSERAAAVGDGGLAWQSGEQRWLLADRREDAAVSGGPGGKRLGPRLLHRSPRLRGGKRRGSFRRSRPRCGT